MNARVHPRMNITMVRVKDQANPAQRLRDNEPRNRKHAITV